MIALFKVYFPVAIVPGQVEFRHKYNLVLNSPEATAKAIDPQGWFDTGDLGWITQQNDLMVTGRAKDTIVLTNGENIEPTPIEDACLRSPYIDQIMLVGQDQRSLGALMFLLLVLHLKVKLPVQ